MRELIVLSIPHTGTRALCAKYNCEFIHTYVSEFPTRIAAEYYQLLNERKILVPLRDPRETWKSWVNRIEEDRGPAPLRLFEPQWYYIDAFYSRVFDLEYHPVVPQEQATGHVAPSTEYDYFNPGVYPQPDWDRIYNMEFVKQHYAPGP
jgi:hypothetical protein